MVPCVLSNQDHCHLIAFHVYAQNDSLATLLARLEGILGPVPDRMLSQGRYTHRYYTRSGALFERNPRTVSAPLIASPRVSDSYILGESL